MTLLADEARNAQRAPEPDPGVGSRRKTPGQNRLFQSSITFFAFILIFAGFGIWLGGAFMNVEARLLDIHQNAPILMLALAALATLVPGLFDLSIAGVATLTAFLVIGLRVQQGWPFGVVIVACVLVGAVVGLVNAFIVERLRVHAFIATLGTGAVCGGLGSVYSRGTVLSPGTTGPQLPNWFQSFGQFTAKAPAVLVALGLAITAGAFFLAVDRLRPASLTRSWWLSAKVALLAAIIAVLQVGFDASSWVTSVSWMIFVLLLVASLMWLTLEYTMFGRHLRAIGSNRAAAELAGVKAGREVVKAFVVGGTLAAVAGVLLSASQGSATPDAASSFLLAAFAAAFVSTVVLSHGRFTVPGTIVGGTFIVWVGQGLIVGGLAATWLDVVNGVILVCAVALSTAMRRRS